MNFFFKISIINIVLVRITQISNCCSTQEGPIQWDYFCLDDWYPVSEGTEVFNTFEEDSYSKQAFKGYIKKQITETEVCFSPSIMCERVIVK